MKGIKDTIQGILIILAPFVVMGIAVAYYTYSTTGQF